MAKRLLFIFRHAPYGSSLAREGLEALLAAGAYEQDVAALFIDDGVLQLLKQQAGLAGQKNHAQMLSALPLYGVTDLYVQDLDLRQRAIAADDLLLDVKRLGEGEAHALMESFDHLLSF